MIASCDNVRPAKGKDDLGKTCVSSWRLLGKQTVYDRHRYAFFCWPTVPPDKQVT